MQTNEKVQQLFDELKSCHPADAGKTCVAIVESLLTLDKSLLIELVKTHHSWAEQQAAVKPLQLGYAKFLLAFGFFYREKYDEALPLLTEAENLFTDQNEPDAAAACMAVQSNIYRTFENVDLALKYSWLCYDQLQKSGQFPFFFMACNINIGGIYFDRKLYEEAIPFYKSALELAEKSEKYYWIIYALHGLGKAYLMQQKYPEAKDYFEKAMVAAEKFNNPHSFSNALTEFGNYYFTTGDYSDAEQFHKRSLTLREQNQFIGAAITNCIRLGEIYIKQFKPDEAIAILEKGLMLAAQIKVKPKMYQIHFLLSEIYQRKNELEKSLFHYKQFHELREQVEVEDSDRKIKHAQQIFEAEQTKKENVIIKQQKAEIERKNIELQETIDELTLARVGKKARAITLLIAIVFFIFEDRILEFALTTVHSESYLLSLIVKMMIIFSLSPINKAVEHYLLRRIIKKKKREVLV